MWFWVNVCACVCMCVYINRRYLNYGLAWPDLLTVSWGMSRERVDVFLLMNSHNHHIMNYVFVTLCFCFWYCCCCCCCYLNSTSKINMLPGKTCHAQLVTTISECYFFVLYKALWYCTCHTIKHESTLLYWMKALTVEISLYTVSKGAQTTATKKLLS